MRVLRRGMDAGDIKGELKPSASGATAARSNVHGWMVDITVVEDARIRQIGTTRNAMGNGSLVASTFEQVRHGLLVSTGNPVAPHAFLVISNGFCPEGLIAVYQKQTLFDSPAPAVFVGESATYEAQTMGGST